MRKPIIKNWTKYWATTLAVSGMLVVGACGDSNQTAENEIESAETEVAAPAREEVANLETDADDRQTVGTENDVEYVEDEANQNVEYDRTSAQPAENSSSFGDMDQHVEEHKEVNEQIRQTLTDDNNQMDQGSTPDQMQSQDRQPLTNGDQSESAEFNPEDQGTPRNNSTSATQQESSSMEDQGTPRNNSSSATQQESSSMDNQGSSVNQEDPNASIYQQDNTSDNASQGTMDSQQNQQQPTTGQQTGTVEYGTDTQGTTEMQMDNTQQSTPSDSQNQGIQSDMNQGTTETEMDNTQSGTPTDSQNQGIQSDMNQGTMDQTQPNNSLQNEQDTNVYDKQSNTNMNEGADAYLIILEERRAEYDAESQKAIDDVMNEYNSRRESMRGQINQETGAYVSPEVDPQPKMGVGELMDQIQENLTYPQNAAAAEIEGTVFVNFVVDENGSITEAEAVEDVVTPVSSMRYATNPLNPTKFTENEIEEAKKEMKEEAIKAVKETSGQWEPAQQGGQVVKSEVQIPVVFDIERIGATEDVPLQE